MYSTTIKPDFRKLQKYLPNITDDDVKALEKSAGIPVDLEYMTEDEYCLFTQQLLGTFKTYGLEKHYMELLYLILYKHEELRNELQFCWIDFLEHEKVRDMAKFLLTYMESNPSSILQLKLTEKGGSAIKPFNKNATIGDREAIKWIVDLIISSLSTNQTALQIFGDNLIGLFDLNSTADVKPYIEKLRFVAERKRVKAKLPLRQLQFRLCFFVHGYLKVQEDIVISEDIENISSDHARLFVDILHSLNYFGNSKKPSEKHLHSLYHDFKKSIALLPIA